MLHDRTVCPRRHAAVRAIATVVASLSMVSVAQASLFVGHFANDVPFINYGGDGQASWALGPPDENAPDLDGGGVTLRFGAASSFDYPGTIPVGTDLIVIEETGESGAIPTILFGYASVLTDADADGIADEAAGVGLLLDTLSLSSVPWSPYPQRLLFFDLSSEPLFHGMTSDFCLAIDDMGDFDVNAVQIIPEPASFCLLILGALFVARTRNRMA